MLNNVVILAGRIVNISSLLEEDNKAYCLLTIAIPRGYKNSEGNYDTDFVDVVLYNDIARHTTEICKIGDLVGVKGTIEKLKTDDALRLVCNKLTFLSNQKASE